MSKDDTELKTVTFYPKNYYKKSVNKNKTNKSKKNYFKWIASSWLHPAEDQPAASWYGVVTLVGELLVFFISLYAFFHQMLVNSMLDIDNVFYILNGSKSNIAEGLVYTKLFCYSVIALIVIIGGTYLIIRYLVSNKKENFWDYINTIAHYSGLNFIITIIIFFLGIFSIGGKAISVLAFLALMIFSVAVLVAVIDRAHEEGLDKVYAGIVTALVIALGLFIFYLLFYSILIKIFSIGMSVFMQMMVR